MLEAGSQSSRSANQWLQRGKTFVNQFRGQISTPPDSPQPSVWYSGLVIEPTEFSCQLARLQVSLQGTNKAALRELTK